MLYKPTYMMEVIPTNFPLQITIEHEEQQTHKENSILASLPYQNYKILKGSPKGS